MVVGKAVGVKRWCMVLVVLVLVVPLFDFLFFWGGFGSRRFPQ